jgi:zinc and cadmium transporter
VQLACKESLAIDSILVWIIAACVAGGALSLTAAALLSFKVIGAWLPRMVSFAVGAMLAAAFLHLLPEAIMQASSVEGVFATTLAGLLALFLLEKVALWRHHHEHGEAHGAGHTSHSHAHRPIAAVVVIGDGFHNFVDGVLIASAFVVSPAVGIGATLAIVAHEVPQETGDFIVLLDCGLSRMQALALNVASSLTAVAGGVVGYYALSFAEGATPYLLALAAASFIYIAVADLIPNLHRASDTGSTAWQVSLIAAGVVAIAVPYALLHRH